MFSFKNLFICILICFLLISWSSKHIGLAQATEKSIESTSSESFCGNGIWESPEQCDDGNKVNDDGCSSRCLLEGRPKNGFGVYDAKNLEYGPKEIIYNSTIPS